MPPTISAAPVSEGAFQEAEVSLERLHFPEEALLNLAHLTSTHEDTFRDQEGWSARVTLEGTTVLIRAEGEHWAIYGPAGADEAEVMFAARKLHGLLGEQREDWDLDR